MATGSGNPDGKAARSVETASSPPSDAPITTRSYGMSSMRGASEQLFPGDERLVLVLGLQQAQRLVRAEPQQPERAQTSREQIVNALLERSCEVDHHVAAEDDVELVEDPIGHEIVL